MKNRSFSFIGAAALISVENCRDKRRGEQLATRIAQGQLQNLANMCVHFGTDESPEDILYAFEAKAEELQMSQNDPCMKALHRHLGDNQSKKATSTQPKRGVGISARNKDGDEHPIEVARPPVNGEHLRI